MNDSVADFLTRIRNAIKADHDDVLIPSSGLKPIGLARDITPFLGAALGFGDCLLTAGISASLVVGLIAHDVSGKVRLGDVQGFGAGQESYRIDAVPEGHPVGLVCSQVGLEGVVKKRAALAFVPCCDRRQKPVFEDTADVTLGFAAASPENGAARLAVAPSTCSMALQPSSPTVRNESTRSILPPLAGAPA